MMFTTLQVALGGAIGAALRFLLGMALLRPGFPVGVLTANVVGSFLMGLAVVYLGRNAPGWQPFVLTGVLGGFTTFSAFSLETLTLIERGDTGQALSYVALSVGLSLAAIWLGVTFARSLA
ncbi:fluoride efflux transporter CrcB [Jannaschia pohangensis]|uniref:Fluoride-specific ion channel FluC n=1 Tax=Jannaschia pohangensis TaxID=390807 RepID=A0A1I3RYN6_9RHOB|nr:fluoride efflux transporter CrcB [Jannaschia pohangensis]SFJ50499.1 camphor resistance protein CrcB [Jannaschia pohangensis]